MQFCPLVCCTHCYFSQEILFVLPIKPALVERTVQCEAPFGWTQSGSPFEMANAEPLRPLGISWIGLQNHRCFYSWGMHFFPLILNPWILAAAQQNHFQTGMQHFSVQLCLNICQMLSTSVKTRLKYLYVILSHTLERQLKLLLFTYFRTFPRNIVQPNS